MGLLFKIVSSCQVVCLTEPGLGLLRCAAQEAARPRATGVHHQDPGAQGAGKSGAVKRG